MAAGSLAYPLEEVLNVKRRRVDEAEREVQRKYEELEREEEILAEKEAARDKVLQHHADKMAQMRKVMDEGTTSPEILQMRAYLKVVKVRVAEEEQKVVEQQEQVDIAEKNLEVAKENLRLRRKEVDKLEQHKEGWLVEAKKELAIEEVREADEMGSVIFLTRMRKQG
ncbi:hypothetical protein SCG7086_AN_00090 [Chlamydiales bacterium SCGC AG-110-P3]|nr:hypothetical protein SCG7086_AN_00090 [Chlamydiales bacterium SCGC AG-110-P3]